jgi:hypothetical protein
MSQMLEIKGDVSSNKFKPNTELFTKENFGSLTLNESSFGDRFKSKILTGSQSLELIKSCEFSPNDKWQLLYRGSDNGFGATEFHSRCDGKANTLSIFKPVGNSNVFGGFASAAWSSTDGYLPDPQSFLFSLVNKDNEPIKMKIDSSRVQSALYGHPSCGPTFGSDISIEDNVNTNNSWSNLGTAYKHPKYSFGTPQAKEFLAGSELFKLSEIEVYSKI